MPLPLLPSFGFITKWSEVMLENFQFCRSAFDCMTANVSAKGTQRAERYVLVFILLSASEIDFLLLNFFM